MEEDDKPEFQVTMNGEIKGFDDLEKALSYILKNKDKLFYCVIRTVFGTGCISFAINRP